MASHTLGLAISRNMTDKKQVEGKGWGLYAKEDILADEDVISVPSPLVISLDIPRLKDTCYSCLGYKHFCQSTEETNWGDDAALQICTGCHVVRYCSKDCQAYSWKARHKHECNLFAQLHPNILPNNVRAIIQLLFLRKAFRLPIAEWEAFMKLTSHLEDWQSRGGENWENLSLMARGTKEYSGTDLDETTLREIFGKLLVNCFTLVSPCYDPLGIVLHPLAALANHSCDYNAVVRVEFHWPGGHRLKVRALRPIANGEEITVSYIDATNPHHVRQRELQDRYFFTCECSKCSDDTLVKKEDIPYPLDPDGYTAIEQRAFDLLAAARKDTSITGPIQKLKYGIHILRKSKAWPLHRQPLASLRQELVVSLIAASQLHHAFLHAWIQYRCIDQMIFPERNHPIRLVHQWLVAALIRRVDISRYGREDLPLQQYNIFNREVNLHRLFGYVLCNLRRKVKDDNFGDFAAMVRRTYFRHSGSLAGNPVGREEFLQEADKLGVSVKRVLKEELVWGDGS